VADWQSVIAEFANNIEEHFDALKNQMADRLGREKLKIIAYRGYGRQEQLYLKGRVLEDKGVAPAEENDHFWENLVNMYRRMESNEIPHARLLVRFDGREQEVQANEEGFFEAWIEPEKPLPTDRVWHEVHLRLIDPPGYVGDSPVEAVGEVFVPPATAQYAVISDIDDTVLKSDATHLLRMARNVFLGNARTRLPFPGVAAFYRALLDGPRGNALNPLFFVSSSPWNLYDLLAEFFHLQNIPLGPILFLRDWGLTENELLPIKNRGYKLGVIHQMMDFYPELPFILVGDSGQEDPEIYERITSEYPDRVLAVYIRNVVHDLKRPEAVRALAEKVIKARSTLILADDTLSIARHAASQGWIAQEALHAIEFEKDKDTAPPTPVEKLLGEDEKPEAPTVVVEEGSPARNIELVEGEGIEQAMQKSKEEGQKPPTVIVQPEGKTAQGNNPAINGDQSQGEN
jgi:phosphatidate phosphatase APP1